MLAGIPTIGLSDRLGPLVSTLLESPEISQVAVYVNVAGAVDRVADLLDAAGVLADDRLDLFCRYGQGIYSIWSLIMDQAYEAGELAVILNDDIRIHPSSLRVAGAVFADPKRRAGVAGWDPDVPVEEYHYVLPVPVSGTYREGGVTGFAFAIDPGIVDADGVLVRPDVDFGWWGGDDDLVWNVMKAGRVAFKMSGIGVDHAASTSSSQRPEVLASLEQDRNRLLYKHRRAW
jgi:GT2 family glycosyltransferase